MSKNVYTATEVRNNFFNLINLVVKTKEPIYIKKNREVVVKLEPAKDEVAKKRDKALAWLEKTRSMWAGRSEDEIRGPFREASRKATLKIRARNW